VVGDGFIFAERDFPTSEKKLFNSSYCFLHSESSKTLLFCWDLFLIDIISLTSSVFFNIMIPFVMSWFQCLFIIIVFGDFFWVGKLISVSFVFSDDIWLLVVNFYLWRAFFFAMEVKLPLVSHGLSKERCSFLDAYGYGACVSRVSLKALPNSSLRAVVFNLFCKIAPSQKFYLEIAPLSVVFVLSENIILFWK